MPRIGAQLTDWLTWATDQIGTASLAMLRGFIPFYEDGAVVAAPVPASALSLIGIGVLALVAVGAWTTRRIPNWWPAPTYVLLFLLYWLILIPPVGYFNWYLPPFTAVAVLLAGAGVQRLARRSRFLSSSLAVVLTIAFAAHLPFSVPLEARVQAEIDDGVRREVGLYLASVVRPGEAVVLEAAGYIGYYSRATVWDFPGLTSPTAYAAVLALQPARRNIAGLVSQLRPPWAVLRPGMGVTGINRPGHRFVLRGHEAVRLARRPRDWPQWVGEVESGPELHGLSTFCLRATVMSFARPPGRPSIAAVSLLAVAAVAKLPTLSQPLTESFAWRQTQLHGPPSCITGRGLTFCTHRCRSTGPRGTLDLSSRCSRQWVPL